MARFLLDLLYPPCCSVCRWPSQEILCIHCRHGFVPVPLPVCVRCGTPEEGGGPSAICPPCRADGPPYALARAMGVYTGTLRAAIRRLKFGGRPELGTVLGGLLAAFVRETPPLDAADMAVPVPLHAQRQRERGYNHAALIAGALAGDLGIPLVEVLERRRATVPQTDLGRQERRANVRGAFAVPPAARQALRGRAVLLVDDVVTSGATAVECAAALRGAGAAVVRVAALARAVLPTAGLGGGGGAG